MKTIQIDTEYIKLGGLLKFIGIADSGVHAKILITEGLVKVNGEIETRRGKKIYHGDQIESDDQVFKIESTLRSV